MNIWEQPILQLAKPQKDYYSVLTGVKEFSSKMYLNNISEISFRVYEYENNERNELYNELEETQLIEAIDYEIEWFQIASVDETKNEDIPVAYKDITCNSLEDELITKTVYNLNGVYKLYNIEDTTKSIMHIITNDISWNIGYISPQLVNLYRTLSIDSSRIYSLLTSDLSKSFDCIFKFNREYKTISAYTLDEIGEETDIVISEQNLLKSWEKNSNKDKIVTKMRCIGGTSTDGTIFDIRKVNFGSDIITNYSYFKPRMSTELQTALTNYENAIESNTTLYSTNLELLKTYNEDLNALNNQMIEIKSQISAQEEVMNTSLKVPSHLGYPPTSTDADYTAYQNAITQLITLNTQKANKQAEIDAKNAQITSVNNTLVTISSNVDKSNFFTSELLEELDCFTYVGDDYSDDTFLSNDETTSVEEIEMALQLKSNAEKELYIACRPQPEFKATLKNLWSLHDEKDCVISYDVWREKFKLGNIVTTILSDDSWTTIRIIGIELDYNDPANAEITFSSRTRLDNSTFNLGEIQAQASRAYSAVSMNKFSWNQAASQTSDNEEFRMNVLNATMNKMVSDDKSQVEIGEYGIKIRPWIESESKYLPSGMWLNPYRMLFTSDGFQTAGAAFGLLTFPDGTQHMALNAEYVMGKVMMSTYTYITNASGNYIFDDSGFTASAIVDGNAYAFGVNPSTPSDLVNVKINGSNVFYLDTINKKLVMKGEIDAQSGKISGNLTVSGSLTGGTFYGSKLYSTNYSYGNTGMYINLSDGTIDTKNFKLSNTGTVTCVDGNFTGIITATGGNIAGFTVNTTQLTSGTGNKFIRISPYSTTPNTRNYTTDYGAIDLGLSSDKYDTVIHLRSDGYARFGLPGDGKCLKLNYVVSDVEEYSIYTSGFKVNSGGMVYTDYISSTVGKPLVLDGANGFGLMAESGDGSIWGRNIDIYNHLGGTGIFKLRGYNTYTIDNNNIIHMGNLPNTYSFTASLTANGNVRFLNQNAACVTWCQDTFEYKTSSDFRLKKDITSLDDIPNELYLDLKPQKFKFKCDPYNKTINFGLIAQEVKSAFEKYGLNADDYKIIEYLNVRDYTDEGLYVNDKINAVDYKQLITWTVKIVQELYRQDEKKSNIIESLLNRIELIEKNNM